MSFVLQMFLWVILLMVTRRCRGLRFPRFFWSGEFEQRVVGGFIEFESGNSFV